MNDIPANDLWWLTSYLPMEKQTANEAFINLNLGIAIGVIGLLWSAKYVFGLFQENALAPRTAPLVKTLMVTGLFSLFFLITTQWVGRMTYEQLRPEQEQTARPTKGASPSRHQHRRADKADVYILLAIASALLVGGGYAFTAMHDLGLVAHMFGFSFGVGICAEFGKLLAVALILAPTLKLLKSRQSLLPFMMAGLGFGLGEALFYFREYSLHNIEWLAYSVRSTWSVLLHVSWSTISGYLILKSVKKLPDTFEIINPFGATFWYLVMFLIPAAVLHGVQDALLVHDEFVYALFIGIASQSLGWLALKQFKKKARQPQAPEPALE